MKRSKAKEDWNLIRADSRVVVCYHVELSSVTKGGQHLLARYSQHLLGKH